MHFVYLGETLMSSCAFVLNCFSLLDFVTFACVCLNDDDNVGNDYDSFYRSLFHELEAFTGSVCLCLFGAYKMHSVYVCGVYF